MAVLLGGVLAHLGKVPLVVVMAAAVLGAVVGDNIGYAVGARLEPKLDARAPDRARRHLAAAEAVVQRWGAPAVLIGRWAALLRAVVPCVAGASGLPYRRFVVFNVLGGALWGVAVAGIGYLAALRPGRAEPRTGRDDPRAPGPARSHGRGTPHGPTPDAMVTCGRTAIRTGRRGRPCFSRGSHPPRRTLAPSGQLAAQSRWSRNHDRD
ncbi:DedA family protein [Georgenia yuyongxinii]|uniref:DedA family protein n=1 Tax=Georgenia yuyongxinii TaxID=2589797 RepID=UPI00362D08CB